MDTRVQQAIAQLVINLRVLTPHKIGIFQEELEKQFAAVYYGTHNRLVELGDVSVRPISPKRGVWIEFAEDGQRVTDILHDPKDAVVPDSFVWCEESCQRFD